MNDITDKQKLFLDNEKLIGFTLKKYFPIVFKDVEKKEEYYSAGSLGLVKACNNYDPTLGTAFSTYAISTIWGEIKRFSRDNGTIIHYSREIKDLSYKILNEYNKSPNEDFEFFLSDKLSKLDISYEHKTGIQNFLSGFASLDDTLRNKVDKYEDYTLSDVVKSSDDVEDDYIYIDYVNNISNKLNGYEKDILKLYLKDMKQEDIAKALNYSQTQISRTLYKIRMHTISQLLLAESYENAFKMLYKIHKNKLTKNKLLTLQSKFHLNFSNCPDSILEKYDLLDIESKNESYKPKINIKESFIHQPEQVKTIDIRVDIIHKVITLLEEFKTNNLKLVC